MNWLTGINSKPDATPLSGDAGSRVRSEREQRHQNSRFGRPGLGATKLPDPVAARMVKQCVELAATVLIHYPPAREKLLERLRKEDRASGQQKPIIEWLVQSARQRVECCPPPEVVFVKRLSRGRLFPEHRIAYADALRILRNEQLDIIVNEREHCFQAPHSPQPTQQPIIPLRKMQRGMLWLVLTNAGGYLAHGDIGDLFDFKVVRPGGGVDERIYQYRIELGRLVGKPLRDKMLSIGSNCSYLVPGKGWSFLWIRTKADVDQSELVWGIRGRPAKTVQQTG
jgi:hypothetical protein